MALGGTLFIAFVATLVGMGMLVLVLESWPIAAFVIGRPLESRSLSAPDIATNTRGAGLYSGALMLGWGPDIFLILVGHSLFVFCFSGLLLGASWSRFDAGFHRQAQSLGLNPLVGAVVHQAAHADRAVSVYGCDGDDSQFCALSANSRPWWRPV